MCVKKVVITMIIILILVSNSVSAGKFTGKLTIHTADGEKNYKCNIRVKKKGYPI